MATAVIIARDPAYGSRCQEAFRDSGLFPFVVGSPARALLLLAQFRAHVVVVERASSGPAEWEPLLVDVVADTPLLTYTELPPPRVLAAAVREAIRAAGGDRPASATEGASEPA